MYTFHIHHSNISRREAFYKVWIPHWRFRPRINRQRIRTSLYTKRTMAGYNLRVPWYWLLVQICRQGWATVCVELLVQNDPRALTIVGYWFMLMMAREQVWWMPGATDYEFWALMGLLPDEWKPRMHWAIQELENRGDDLMHLRPGYGNPSCWP